MSSAPKWTTGRSSSSFGRPPLRRLTGWCGSPRGRLGRLGFRVSRLSPGNAVGGSLVLEGQSKLRGRSIPHASHIQGTEGTVPGSRADFCRAKGACSHVEMQLPDLQHSIRCPYLSFV